MKRNLIILVGIALLALPAWGQRTSYSIYPIPQQTVMGQARTAFSPRVAVVADAAIDAATVERAFDVLRRAGLEPFRTETAQAGISNLFLAVDGQPGAASDKATQLSLDRTVLTTAGKFDRHLLHLTDEGGKAQTIIVGEHTTAAFHALASLEQMLEEGTSGLPTVTLNDYADQQSRGLVEGYYGYPYSVAVKEDLMRFMMRMKMNTYMYGAKSDSYHSEKWEEPYPTQLTPLQVKNGLLSQDMVRQIARTSAATKVNFIWAIHPGNDFVGNPNVVNRIMRKFESMYGLGIRQFAIFVDDVGVPTSEADCKTNADHLTAVQNAIDRKWNTASATPEAQVRPLHFVPQVYTLSWVGETERKRFFKALQQCPDKITVYFTGWGVWTVPNSQDLAVMRQDFGRNVAWWWNYPCNDNADERIYPSDMYHNFTEMPNVGNGSLPRTLTNGLGIVSNPMQEGEVSKTALFSVADYAWNNRAFDNRASWEASFRLILSTPEKREAYKTLIPYLRYNDPEEMRTAVASFKAGRPQAFLAIADRLSAALDVVEGFAHSEVESDRLLHADLRPWLLKLRDMVRAGRGMAASVTASGPDERWTHYVSQLAPIAAFDTSEDYAAYALEGMGQGVSVSRRPARPAQRNLFPLFAHLRENALGTRFFGTPAKSIDLLRSSATIASSVSLSKGTAYVNAAAALLPPKGYVGFTLRDAVRPAQLAVADTLIANQTVLYSANGKSWQRLTSATLPDDAFVKHLVVYNPDDTPRRLRLTRAELSLTLPSLPTLSSVEVPTTEVGEASGNLGVRALIDGNPDTFFAGKQNQRAGDTYTVHLAEPTHVQDVRVYFGTKNDDFLQLGAVEASTNGQEWTPLTLSGTQDRNAGLAQSVPESDEVRRLTFTGSVPNATMVRLRVVTPKTNKWLRLYDLQVNAEAYAAAFLPLASDGQGTPRPATIDGKAYTRLDAAKGGFLRYELLGVARTDRFSVYWDSTTWHEAAPRVELTTDGTTWQTLGTLTTAATHFDLTAHRDARALRITWEGTAVPPIYELVEQSSAAPVDLHPTGIATLRPDAAVQARARHIFDLNGHLLRTDGSTDGLAPGIYLVGGRKVVVH